VVVAVVAAAADRRSRSNPHPAMIIAHAPESRLEAQIPGRAR
jgi:hypothetical protein